MFRSATFNLFFTLGFAVFFLGVLPLWDLTTQMSVRIDGDNQLLEELQILQQEKEKLLKEYKSADEKNLKRLAAVIPVSATSFDIATLYFFFETIGRENGLRIKSLEIDALKDDTKGTSTLQPRKQIAQPSYDAGEQPVARSSQPPIQPEDRASAEESGVNQITVNIRTVGAYDSLKAFLRAVEGSLRLIDVASFSISKPENDGSLLFSVVLKMYHQ